MPQYRSTPKRSPTPLRTQQWRDCSVWTPLDGATPVHTTPHTTVNPLVGDCCDAHPPPSEWISPLRCDGLILTGLGLLLLVMVRSVAVCPIFAAFCRFPFDVLMADMVHNSFLTNSIVCCACKIISSGITMTNLRLLYRLVYSDLAINAWNEVKLHFCSIENMVHRCTQYYRRYLMPAHRNV